MAAAINFSGQASPPHMCFKAVARHPRGILPCKETCQLKNNSLRSLQHGLHVGRKAESRMLSGRTPIIVMSANSHSIFESFSSSPSDTINKFYTSINEKNLKELSEFISEDCYIEDCSFPQPFNGKKVSSSNYSSQLALNTYFCYLNRALLQEIMHFYEQLTASMGQNVKFSIGHVCEGDENTAGVQWHLGNSHFYCFSYLYPYKIFL